MARRTRHLCAGLTVTFVATLAACGPTVTSTKTVPTTTATLPAPIPTSTASTVASVETTTTTGVAQTLLLEDWEGGIIDFGPVESDQLAVVGVSFNDVLNVRSGPGLDHDVIAMLAPGRVNVLSLGITWALPESIWYTIDAENIQGWAHSAFLAYEGASVDFTPTVLAELGTLPKANTLVRLGKIVAEAFASTEPPSSIEQSGESIVESDRPHVTFDVLGLGDDALYGYRFAVFATEAGGEWTMNEVQATVYCYRGVDNGVCL